MSSSDNVDTYAESLNKKIWTTKGSRFNAARRLNNKFQFSITSISILSIYGVSIPILQGIINVSKCPQLNSIYTAVSTILSISILVLSLLDSSKNYQVRADRLYNNALKIRNLHRQLEYAINCELNNANFQKKIQDFSSRYEKLINECPENHDTEDYDLFRAQHREDFKISWMTGTCIRLKIFINDYWFYVFVLVIPPLIALFYTSC